MKIIGNKDYWDYCVGYGSDDSVVYKRQLSETEIPVVIRGSYEKPTLMCKSREDFSGSVDSYLEKVIQPLYSDISSRKLFNSNRTRKGDYFVSSELNCVLFGTQHFLMIRHCITDGTKVKYTYEPLEEMLKGDSIYLKVNKGVSNIVARLCKDFNNPILNITLTQERYKGFVLKIQKGVILKDLHLQKYVEGTKIYQEVENWLLSNSLPKTIEIEDCYKITGKGFDSNISFRHRKA